MNYPIQKTLLALAASMGSYQFYQNYQIEGLHDVRLQPRSGEVKQLPSTEPNFWDRAETRLVSREVSTGSLVLPDSQPPVEPTAPTESIGPLRRDLFQLKPIHVASFNLQGFGRLKVDKPAALDKIARLCRNFEVVALQGIIGPDRDLMPRLVQAMNQTGAQYDYLETFEGPQMRLAILFDTARIETDRRQMYRVADPNNQLTVDPLVGWFRVKGIGSREAWTFSLANVWISPSKVTEEILLIPEIIRAVHNDGRGEDDVIVAGAFATEVATMQRLVFPVQYKPATIGVSTDIYNRTAFDHVLVPITDHSEFTGRGGALDFLRVMNLTLGEAEEISDRLPAWAEFTSTEGI